MRNRVLVVEDDEFIREIIVVSLEEQGFKVDVFPNSNNLWRYLKRCRPHLVFLDLALPNEDGLTICRKLRASSSTADLPVVIVSAMSQPLVISAAMEAGANAFIKKPFDIDELVAAAKTYSQSNPNGSIDGSVPAPGMISQFGGRTN